MDKAKIKSTLKTEIEEFLSAFKKNDVERDDALVILDKDHFIPLSQIEWDLFYSPIKFMLDQKEIFEKYSDVFIESEFLCLYRKMLFKNGSSSTITIDDSNIDTYIENLINKLLNSSEKTFCIISEVENIEVRDDKEYKIIDSTIKIMRQENLPYEDKKFQQFSEDLIEKLVILTKVQAGDFDRAKELAFYNFNVSINLFRLYFPYSKPIIKGYLAEESQHLIGYSEENKIPYRDATPVRDLRFYSDYLDDKKYRELIDVGITALEKDGSISKVVKDSLYWFGLGLDEEYPTAKLVDFTLVLESVLKKKNERTELRRTIAERGAILLFNTFEERKNAVKDLIKIYDMRSKVVHTGTTIENKNIVSTAEEYASKVTKKLIAKSEEFNGDFDKFIDYLDDTKLRGTNDV